MNKQTSVITKDLVFLAGQKEVSTTMVEINISVKIDGEIKLQDLLTHIVMEITDEDYRNSHMNTNRYVDMNWVHMEDGKYQWSRNERS
jgi:hypothetical protein